MKMKWASIQNSSARKRRWPFSILKYYYKNSGNHLSMNQNINKWS